MKGKRSTRAAALWYAGQGWKILPIWPVINGKCGCKHKNCKSIGKHPVSEFVPKGLENATSELAIVGRWWDRRRDWNLATSSWFRIDVDLHKNGLDKWRELIFDNAYFDTQFQTLVCKTPSGGLHYYFKPTSGYGLSNSTGKLPAGIDVRGHETGYTLLPPSNHVRGLYEWGENSPKDIEIPLPPEWLCKLVGKGDHNLKNVLFSERRTGPVDIEEFSVSRLVVQVVLGDRSGIDQGIISALVRAGATDDQIRAVFCQYPVGEKYREKERHGDNYLALSISKARAFVSGSNGQTGDPTLDDLLKKQEWQK